MVNGFEAVTITLASPFLAPFHCFEKYPITAFRETSQSRDKSLMSLFASVYTIQSEQRLSEWVTPQLDRAFFIISIMKPKLIFSAITKFVQVKREDFVRPTEHSVICNIHFPPYCYEKSFMVKIGLKKQKQLIPGAVPTVQSPAASNYSEGQSGLYIQNEDTKEPEVVDSANKRPKRSRDLQKLEVNSYDCIRLEL